MNRRVFAVMVALSGIAFARDAAADCGRSAGTPDSGATACDDTAPICVQGTCVGCTADFGAGGLAQCPTVDNPYCTGVGADADAGDAGLIGPGGLCGKCGDHGGDSACAQTSAVHPGPTCTGIGACGNGCAKDADCTAMQFCEGQLGTCTAKIADGMPLPAGDTCDVGTAMRECASAQCDPATNACGPPKPIALDASAGSADAAAPVSPPIAETPGPTYVVGGGGCSLITTGAGAGSFAALLAALGLVAVARARRQRVTSRVVQSTTSRSDSRGGENATRSRGARLPQG